LFGGKMALHNNRLIVTAMGATFKSGKRNFDFAGTAYVYERPEGTIFWLVCSDEVMMMMM